MLLLAAGLASVVACGPSPSAVSSAAPTGPAGSAGPLPASTEPGPGASPGSTSAAVGRFAIAVTMLGIHLPTALSRAVAFSTAGATIQVAGGLTNAGTTDRILGIAVPNGPITVLGRLPTAVHDAGGADLAGSPVVVGGGDLVPETIVQAFTAPIGSLPQPRADLVAVSVNGMLVVVGGGTSAGPDTAVLATTDGVTFRHLATLTVGVRYPAVAVVGGTIIVVGGTAGGVDQTAIQAIDPATGVVRRLGSLPRALSHASALVLDGHLIVAGGRGHGAPLDTIEEIDPTSGAVRPLGHLPTAMSDAVAVVVGSAAYLVGGEAGGVAGTGLLRTIVEISPAA